MSAPLEGFLFVDVGVKIDLEAMSRDLSPEQIEAVMLGVAQVLAAGKEPE
jgi:hypothetical protein